MGLNARRSEWADTRAIMEMMRLGMTDVEWCSFIVGVRFGIKRYTEVMNQPTREETNVGSNDRGNPVSGSGGSAAGDSGVVPRAGFSSVGLAAALCGFQTALCSQCGREYGDPGPITQPFICGYCTLEQLQPATDWADGSEAA